MNIVTICGGLGNQLFQYAFAKRIECSGSLVGLDVSWYNRKDKKHPRPFRLLNFETVVRITPRQSRCSLVITENPDKLQDVCIMQETTYHGYWQSPLYHKAIYTILQNEFWVRPEFYTKEYKELRAEIESCNSVALHVRRGDFLEHPLCYVVPIDYYKKALSIVKNLKSNPHIFVFSDDLLWCEQAFVGEDCTFVHMADYLEFDLMRLCKTKIIGNSTFAWWPAYLDDTGLVLCSDKWWTESTRDAITKKNGMLLESWIKL